MARKRKRRQSQQKNHGWVSMLFGLGIGLTIAVGVYFSGYRAPAPSPAALPQAETPVAPQATSPAAPTAGADDSTSEPHPASRFDFYDMLPLVEVVIPETPRNGVPASATTEVEDAGNYVLQAGAFTVREDADRMQANLALLGIESRIQSVPIDDDIYHRVRIGPIDELAELNRIRRRLWEADVDTMLLRIPN
jgi:cell division protein FtsN